MVCSLLRAFVRVVVLGALPCAYFGGVFLKGVVLIYRGAPTRLLMLQRLLNLLPNGHALRALSIFRLCVGQPRRFVTMVLPRPRGELRYASSRVTIVARERLPIVHDGVYPQPMGHLVDAHLSRLPISSRLLRFVLVYGGVFSSILLSVPSQANDVSCGPLGPRLLVSLRLSMGAILAKETFSRGMGGLSRVSPLLRLVSRGARHLANLITRTLSLGTLFRMSSRVFCRVSEGLFPQGSRQSPQQVGVHGLPKHPSSALVRQAPLALHVRDLKSPRSLLRFSIFRELLLRDLFSMFWQFATISLFGDVAGPLGTLHHVARDHRHRRVVLHLRLRFRVGLPPRSLIRLPTIRQAIRDEGRCLKSIGVGGSLTLANLQHRRPSVLALKGAPTYFFRVLHGRARRLVPLALRLVRTHVGATRGGVEEATTLVSSRGALRFFPTRAVATRISRPHLNRAKRHLVRAISRRVHAGLHHERQGVVQGPGVHPIDLVRSRQRAVIVHSLHSPHRVQRSPIVDQQDSRRHLSLQVFHRVRFRATK